MQFLAVFAVWLALLGSARVTAQHPKTRINADTLAIDLTRIEQLSRVLEAPEVTLVGLRRALEPCDVIDARALGFGAWRITFRISGGYTKFGVRVLGETRSGEHGSHVVIAGVAQWCEPDTWAPIRGRMRYAWGRPARESMYGLAWECDDSEFTRALRKRTEDALGGHVVIEEPNECATAFGTLMSPFENMTVGWSVGITGAPPHGCLEMMRLVDAGRFDLVRAVLRGFNPEARVFAAHALLARGTLDRRDEAAIAVLRTLDIDLATSAGCRGGTGKFAAALAVLD
jgi:hypothetical protein